MAGFQLLEPNPTRVWSPAGWDAGYGGKVYPTGADTSHLIMLDVPRGWLAANVEQFWTASAGGAVHWRLSYVAVDSGFVVSPVTFGTATSPAAGALIVTRQQFWTGLPLDESTDGKLLLNLTRLGTDPADTCAGDAILYGLQLDKVAPS